ncbi:MAG: LPS-assembly protein LptD, partial [Candidatus Omnitrophica bacterium]|nr:LPS-assembly protein LptD [Candidatus Omnitrophota bacterium]
NYSFLSFIVQKRINSWYTHEQMVPDERLPTVSFNLPSYPFGLFNLYFKNQTEFSNLLNKDISSQDDDVLRFDTYNELFLPMRISIFNIKPSVGVRETYYSKDKEGNSLDPRTVFYTGIDLSTKFYRFFNLYNSLFDINGIRHTVTPNIKYIYNHRPTIPKDKLQTFDEIDTIERNHYLNLELVNKFQTKRKDDIIDLAIFKITTDYSLVRNDLKSKGFSDLLFDMELIPFAWLRVESDTTFDLKQNNFKVINFDIGANFDKGKSFGLSHRYERKGGKELTSEFNWRFNPKWKFKIYERYQFAKIRGRGLKEQEYSLTRDLHCWILDFIYNISKDHGHTFWFIFRLKAFPEVEFEFEQSYHGPKKSIE